MDKTNIKAEIVELKADVFDIIAEFQAGHDNKATLKVAAVTQKIMNILASINSIGVSEILSIDFNILNTILLNTTKSLEIGNYILINDLFEYELIPMLNTWLSKLETSISEEA